MKYTDRASFARVRYGTCIQQILMKMFMNNCANWRPATQQQAKHHAHKYLMRMWLSWKSRPANWQCCLRTVTGCCLILLNKYDFFIFQVSVSWVNIRNRTWLARSFWYLLHPNRFIRATLSMSRSENIRFCIDMLQDWQNYTFLQRVVRARLIDELEHKKCKKERYLSDFKFL